MTEEIKVGEQPNSAKISINAKGQWSGEVKAYAETIEEAMKKTILHAETMAALINVKND